ncbi:siderophore ABC transporter substrate-binding protein [Anaerosalibacter massiliensis]|uniref:Siderophore ABC transporter substrate-binding protein n=1 Tax=Anaerosalibacter massiliensis TaxID=1347392 RepID=A0A9X2S618_9FIRM|nr:siderophore ABC transporter substrate-binding protein [Anaerosalibacter massiliensis]MCR2044879.1 siderophore ABC transporter substrate-binding protein [Anaerosalibacter massiliensis]
MKKNKGLILLLMVIISALAVTACNTKPLQEGNKEVSKDNSEGKSIDKSITIKHELDETTLDKKPEKVIVFDYGVLDALDKMGKDIIGLPKKSIPTYLDKYKEDKYEDVGSLKEPNFEKIYELNPDLIIISGRQAKLYDEFKEIAPTVYLAIDGEDYIGSFKDNMEILGQIYEEEDLVKAEIEKVESAINDLKKEAEKSDENSLLIMANDGDISAYGEGSRFGILHKEFGLTPVDKNIESSTHGQKITFEYIVEQNPDYLFVVDRGVVVGGETSAEQVLDNDLIKSTKAYKNDRIIYLDAQVWYVSSGGFTGTMKMVEEVQSAITK